jgi:ElaB/YqjD/DUF883 family membrane-anchored ribosome-binding protein
MNTEAKASHDALGLSQRSTADHHAFSYDRNKDKLLADLKTVVADAETLIKEAAGSSVERFATLRTRFETKLSETRAGIDRARAAVGEKTKHATDATHAYVKQNPWKSVGVFAAAGVILGILLRRR